MNTYTVYLIQRPNYSPGFPYLRPADRLKRCEITLRDGAADMMREFKQARNGGARAYDAAGVMADYLEEHPDETDHPWAVERFLVPFLRRMFTIRKPFWEGSPHY